ncbi:hypothetical protein [Clostridium vincentii]|nr:hypothetical protein [Clostridium vincentii]
MNIGSDITAYRMTIDSIGDISELIGSIDANLTNVTILENIKQ